MMYYVKLELVLKNDWRKLRKDISTGCLNQKENCQSAVQKLVSWVLLKCVEDEKWQ